jgi:AdoMet-dependent heme synthase
VGLFEKVFDNAARELVPLSVHFDLTYRCHQRCVHCYIPEAWRLGEGPGPELTTVQVEDILDQLAAAGTFFLTFSGGEIFLRLDLFEILEYARGLNFSISLMSSGSRGWDDEKVKALADLGMEAVLFSLYGLEAKLHDRVTGMPGSWQRVMDTINQCRKEGLLVVLNSPVLRRNFQSAPALKSWAESQGHPLRMDDTLSPRWDSRPHLPEVPLGPEESAWLHREVGPKAGCPPKEVEANPLSIPDGVCQAGWSSACITPSGEIWPCLELRWPCGALGKGEKFTNIWQEAEPFNWLRGLTYQDRDRLRTFCPYLRGRALTNGSSIVA